jgi:hypothetical protein
MVSEKNNEGPMGALAALAIGLTVSARRRRGSR